MESAEDDDVGSELVVGPCLSSANCTVFGFFLDFDVGLACAFGCRASRMAAHRSSFHCVIIGERAFMTLILSTED
jgi:hypothetical protein